MTLPTNPGGPSRVAFQGELGAFSEEAVYRYFGEAVEPIPQRDFPALGQAVLDAEVEYGMLPIENTLAGSVVGGYDVLAGGALRVIGEVITPIHHCVLGLPGADLDEVRRFLSHPIALMQCTRFLSARPEAEAVAVYDTAGAAKQIAADGDPRQAAIASRRAATRYDLELLAENIEDRPDNQTRFLVVVTPDRVERPLPAEVVSHPQMKSVVLVETRNHPGALVRILQPFANRGINLAKLESRPAGEPWTYRFFIELEADATTGEAAAALDEVQEWALKVQLLGSFPRWAES